MTPEQMKDALKGVSPGQTLFVSYLVGREPTERAIREALPHTTNPFRSRRHFVGEFANVRTTKNGDEILTIHAQNRNTGDKPGGYRSFNPRLGQLLGLTILS